MKLQTLLASSVLACALSPVLAGPVRYESLRSDVRVPYGPTVILLQTPREGVLQNIDPRTAPVRSVTATTGGNPYDARSPLPYGAPLSEAEDVVLVRPRENIPYIAISPWEEINDRTIDELERNYPWIRRTESIRNDLVNARNQYLRERGYINSVRGFKNQSPEPDTVRADEQRRVYGRAQDPAGQSNAEPQLVIVPSDPEQREQVVEDRLKDESIIRRNDSN